MRQLTYFTARQLTYFAARQFTCSQKVRSLLQDNVPIATKVGTLLQDNLPTARKREQIFARQLTFLHYCKTAYLHCWKTAYLQPKFENISTGPLTYFLYYRANDLHGYNMYNLQKLLKDNLYIAKKLGTVLLLLQDNLPTLLQDNPVVGSCGRKK